MQVWNLTSIVFICLFVTLSSPALAMLEAPSYASSRPDGDFSDPDLAGAQVRNFDERVLFMRMRVDRDDLDHMLKEVGGVDEEGNPNFSSLASSQVFVILNLNRISRVRLDGELEETVGARGNHLFFGTFATNNRLERTELLFFNAHSDNPDRPNEVFGAGTVTPASFETRTITRDGLISTDVKIRGESGLNMRVKLTADQSLVGRLTFDRLSTPARTLSPSPGNHGSAFYIGIEGDRITMPAEAEAGLIAPASRLVVPGVGTMRVLEMQAHSYDQGREAVFKFFE